MAFLDYDGLSRFWGKVKDYIASNSGGRGNAKVFVGTCDTAGWVGTKYVTCPDYDQLVVGDKIYVTFTKTNGTHPSSISLNVNDTGAKYIRKRSAGPASQPYLDQLLGTYDIGANSECLFTYDGTYWVLSETTAVYAENITYEDTTSRSLVVSDSRQTDSSSRRYSARALKTSSEVYVLQGKLYVGNSQVATASDVVQSNQGVANAGKFLVVNSSGVVEPVSMTAWQGGSY